MIRVVTCPKGVQPKTPALIPLSSASTLKTPRAYALAVSVFAGCLMAQPERPKINDIDNATGEHFNVSGRAVRFDRTEVFGDLEVWKRDVDPNLWAQSAPIYAIGFHALKAAMWRTNSKFQGGEALAALDLYASEDAIRAAGLVVVAVAYAFEDCGVELAPHMLLETWTGAGWALWQPKGEDDFSFDLHVPDDPDKKICDALATAQAWLDGLSIPRISDMLKTSGLTQDNGPTEPSTPTDYREAARLILAELADLCNGWALPYIDQNRHGLTVYHDAELTRASFDVMHAPFDVANSTVTNLYKLRLIDENGLGREAIGVAVEKGAQDLLNAYHQAIEADSVADRIKAASDFLDKLDDSAQPAPLKPDGTPDIAAMNAAAAAEWAARDEAAGIDNTASKNLAQRAAEAAGMTPTPDPKDETMSKKTPAQTPDQPSASNPFKTPPKPSAPPEAKSKNPMGEKTAGMGDPLELKNPTSPDKAAEEADQEKIKKLKEAHRAIVHKARPELTAGLVSFGGDVETIVIGPIVQGYTEEGLQRTGKLTLTLRPAFKDVTSRALQRWLTVYRDFDGRAAELVDRLADDLAAVVKYDRVKVDFSHVEDGLPLKATAKRGYDSPD